MPKRQATSSSQGNQFGTFGGVFTPSILTILGLILFMRANQILGNVGVLAAIAILLISKSITFLTSLSISAISTNMQVKGGGAYFLISRVLGPEFGGAIGIALFFALALSVPFYLLGFTEALVTTFPSLTPHFQKIAFAGLATFFVVAWVGASWAIKTQYVIMGILVSAILAFMIGSAQAFSLATFKANLYAAGPGELKGLSGETLIPLSFWAAFAIYFPAVTGIDAGVNMSGDLKDPARSIPTGT
ncbi:MAG: amino acid permease, partial [Planctomycetota bacterium]